MSFVKEGDIGGYAIPQYRKKKWQIPKYRVENRPNTDTAYFNHIRKLMGGGGAKYKKYIFAQGKIKWKNINARQLTHKNIHAMA